jgi:hypothetical protein
MKTTTWELVVMAQRFDVSLVVPTHLGIPTLDTTPISISSAGDVGLLSPKLEKTVSMARAGYSLNI